MEPSIQEKLFQLIRDQLPDHASLADVVASELHLSMDSVYRRIRGETPLILEEASLLCQRFQLSLDQLLLSARLTVAFEPVYVDGGQGSDFESFLKEILQRLSALHAERDKEIFYLAKDLPFFYDFAFPALFNFHYFFWMKSIMRHPDFLERPFEEQTLPPVIAALGEDILRIYTQIPSTEILNSECMNSTMAQIRYYREAGYIREREEVRTLFNCLHQTIDHLRLQAELGCKFLPQENPVYRKDQYRFFQNRLVLGENTILVRTGQKHAAYINHDVLQYMFTTDQSFCNRVAYQMNNLIRSATLLSQSGDKARNQFFNRLAGKLPATNDLSL